MSGWRRRSVLATGAAMSIGSVLAAGESGTAEPGAKDASLAEPDGWSSYRGTAGNTAWVPVEGSFPEPETVAWEYDQDGRAAIVGGTVYLRTGEAVHALDAADGSVRWKREDIGAGGTPAVAGDAVIVGGDALTVLDADSGAVRWSEAFEDGTDEHEPVVTSPTAADGVAYVVANGELLAYDVADGTLRWARESVELEESADEVTTEPGSEVAAFGAAPVAVANGFVYALADVAGIAAVDAEDGTTAWTHWRRGYDGFSFSDIAATAERVYVSGSPEDDFPVVEAATGEQIGAVPSVFAPAATESVRVAASRDALRVHDYDTDEGWEQVGGTSGWRDPAIVGETIVVPYYPGYNERAVFGLALGDGSERWEFTDPVVDVDALADWYAVTEDTIYTTGENGLVALRAADDGTDDGDGDESDGDEEDEAGDDDGESGDGEDADTDEEDDTEEGTDEDEDAEDAGDEEFDGKEAGNETDDGTETDGSADSDGDEDDSEESADDGGEIGGAGDEDGDGTDDELEDADGGTNERTDGETDGDDEGTPGFTTGAGIAGGALGLEWLRRRASTADDS